MNPEVTLKIDALDNTKQAFDSVKRNISGVDASTKTLRDRMESMQPTFQKMAAVGTVALGAVAYGSNRAIMAASDLEESMNAVNVVFGSSASKVLEFGENAASAVGLSNAAFNQLATNTGTVLSNTGKSMDEVAEMTNELSVRAADLASVYNTDVETAMNAIRSALIGQSEPLRNLGVVMSETQTKAFALSTGIIEVDREMTEQEKTLARYLFIMDATTKQAGDFANTSDGLANTQRRLAAETEDLAAKIGKSLMPVKQQLLAIIAPIIEKLGEWVEENPELTKTLIVLAGALAGVTAAVGALGIALFVVASPFTLIAAAISSLIGLVIIVNSHFDKMPKVFQVILFPLKALIEGFKRFWDVISGVASAVTSFFRSAEAEIGASTTNIQRSMYEVNGQFVDFLAMAEKGPVKIGGATGAIKDMGDAAGDTAKKLEDLKREALGVLENIDEGEESSKRQLAEAIIEQERSVSDKKKELRRLERGEDSDSNATRIRELRETIRAEEQSLRSIHDFKASLRLELEEAERRADLTAFERKVEDIQRERLTRLQAQVARLQEIQQEIAAEKAKSSAISSAFVGAQETMQSAIEKTREVAEAEAERMKNAFDRAVKSMAQLNIGGSSRLAPSVSSRIRSVNDAVISPKGDIISTHPDDWLIATKDPGSLRGGGGITINISGTFMDDRDAAKRMGREIIRQLQTDARVA